MVIRNTSTIPFRFKVKWNYFLLLLFLLGLPLICIADENERCAERCSDNRPKGSNAAFTLDCRQAYYWESDRDSCSSDCKFCENAICNEGVDRYIFHCPGTSPTEGGGEKHYILDTAVIIIIVVACLGLGCCIGVCVFCCFYVGKQEQKRMEAVEEESGDNGNSAPQVESLSMNSLMYVGGDGQSQGMLQTSSINYVSTPQNLATPVTSASGPVLVEGGFG